LKAPAPPPRYYYTVAEQASEWNLHTDAVLYYMDGSALAAAAIVQKTSLPFDLPGPAPHIVVLLDRYREMAWQTVGDDRIAPLLGEHRAYEVDGHQYRNLTLSDCDGVCVRRSDLVVTLTAREDFEAMCAHGKRLNPVERNTFLLTIGALVNEAFPDQAHHPYAVAETISRDLSLMGVALSKQTIASKIIDAQEALLGAEQAAA
jgi:hypothetical protein